MTASVARSPDVLPLPLSLRDTDPVMLRAGDRAFTRGQVLGAASFRGDLDPLRHTIRLGLVAQQYVEDEQFEIDGDALQAAFESYRIDRDLSTAEDTERWLDDHGLSIDDFTAWLERRAWRERFSGRLEGIARDYDVEPEDVDALLWPEIVFGDHLPILVEALAFRLAAWRERAAADETLSWPEELEAMEGVFDTVREQVTCPANLARELEARRSQLIRFDAQIAAFASLDAAREAWLCVAEDGDRLDVVAADASVEFTSAERFLDEFPESLRDRVLSSAPGEVLSPVEEAGSFLVCRIVAKRVPETVDEPCVGARLEATLLDRALHDLVHKHVTIVQPGGVAGAGLA